MRRKRSADWAKLEAPLPAYGGGYLGTARRFMDNLVPLVLGVFILIAPVLMFAALLRVICLVTHSMGCPPL
jgi:hypothetical protein